MADIKEPMPLDSVAYKRRPYLEAKDADASGHKYTITSDSDTTFGVLGANYAKVQADSPQIPHPTKDGFTRLLTASEHCNVRNMFGRLKDQIVAIAEGTHMAQKSKSTNSTLAHRMCGNSVTPEPWEAGGELLGWFSKSIFKNSSDEVLEENINLGAQELLSEFQFSMSF